MPAQFDPYHTWLGIPPEEQPADHYRLLGIRRFESKQDVIENAAEQRLTHIRSFLAGPKASESQRLLDELSSARDVLRKTEAKGTYDRELRQKDAPKVSKGSPNSLAPKPASPHKPTARSGGAASSATTVPADPPAPDPLWEDPLYAQSLSQPHYPYAAPAGAWPAGYAGHPGARPLWQQPIMILAAVLVGLSLLGVVAIVAIFMGGRMFFPTGGAPRQVTNGPPQFPPGQFVPNATPPLRPSPSSPPSRPPSNSPPVSFTPATSPSLQASLVQPKSAGFALQFAGSGCYVEVENTHEIAKLDGPNTIELWVRWPDGGKDQTLLGNMWAEVKFDEGGKLKPWTGWALCIVREGGSGQANHFHTTGLGAGCNGQSLMTAPSSQQWHHFAYAFDGLGAEIFIDGKRAGPQRLTQSVKGNQAVNLFLGPSKYSEPSRNQFQGEICAFRVSSTKRYTEEFKPPPSLDKDDQTIALLDFSKEQGATIEDLTENGHRGKIVGAKWMPLGG